MNTFLQEASKRLADRWLTLLVLPGLLWCGAAVAALALGHVHAFDPAHLVATVESHARRLQQAGTVATVAALFGLALTASAVGLAVRPAGAVIERCWMGQWPRLFARPAHGLTLRRRRAWLHASEAYEQAVLGPEPDEARLEELALRRNRVSLATPARPTWMGDRMAAVDARVLAHYRLDLVSAWPRLWLLLDDSSRAELRHARGEFDAAARLGGWSVLYLVLAVAWWPAAVVSTVCMLSGWVRARAAVAALADLVEATVDLHGSELATALGLTDTPRSLTPELGLAITRRTRKGA
ncbi:hypothetical protein [Streptomyces boluensis]|uniref:Vegetative cell wall protein gp1 n=1 Tax=Streptomyces boluensis TaxID=1775135 RepID=A0A964UPF1_9ACTN|nr:hypothetical protein [Streptomyces boluensis]NBE52994.1 hypothetical protein [Streptomyces boluensis]